MESRKMYAAKTIPGKEANLPPYIKDRMVKLDMVPTLTHLAGLIGTSKQTLGQNLSGLNKMSYPTAARLADALEVSLDDLRKNLPFLEK
jgi:transcriptional regulator with XRE-family HTH domain